MCPCWENGTFSRYLIVHFRFVETNRVIYLWTIILYTILHGSRIILRIQPKCFSCIPFVYDTSTRLDWLYRKLWQMFVWITRYCILLGEDISYGRGLYMDAGYRSTIANVPVYSEFSINVKTRVYRCRKRMTAESIITSV